MEISTALIIVSAIVAVPASLFPILHYKFGAQSNKKQQKKNREETLLTVANQNIRDLQEGYEAKIKQLKEEVTSLQRSNSRYKALINKYKDMELEDQDEDQDDRMEIEQNYDIDWIKAAQVGKQLGLDTSKIDPNNPVLTNYIKDKILENRDLALFMGILKPKGAGNSGSVTPNQTGDQSDIFSAGETSNLPAL